MWFLKNATKNTNYMYTQFLELILSNLGRTLESCVCVCVCVVCVCVSVSVSVCVCARAYMYM